MITNESTNARLKHRRPIGSKDSAPIMRQTKEKYNTHREATLAKGNTTFFKQIPKETKVLEQIQAPKKAHIPGKKNYKLCMHKRIIRV